jgi:glyoxylase-like metal-dependent hydrolase (beta-lactamase superfamily II)
VRELADGVWLLDGRPRHAFNVYLLGDVLLDAGTVRAQARILRQLGGRELGAHALTHAHPDHQGSSHAICERFSIPLWCGQDEVPAMESIGGWRVPKAPGWLNGIYARLVAGPPHPVSRALVEGDEVAGFAVLETPGHTRGHASYWRESDGVLIVGDVLMNLHPVTARPGLHEPPRLSTEDIARNRGSARKLAALRPRLACFGHGPPLRDPGRLAEFASRLAT